MFRRVGSTWAVQAALFAPNGQANDRLGRSIDVYSECVVAGAPLDDDAFQGQGSLHCWEFAAGSWSYGSTIDVPDPQQGANLGRAIDLEANALAASAPGADGLGAVYVFERSGNSWRAAAKLANPGGPSDEFGVDVALNSDVLVVGAPEYDGAFVDSGAAWIFQRSGDSWTLRLRLDPTQPRAGGRFGSSVATANGTIAVGAPFELAGNAAEGAAYVFGSSGTDWTLDERLLPNESSACFGSAIALDRDALLVGAKCDSAVALRAGAAHLFVRTTQGWDQVQRLAAGNAGVKDNLGASVDLFDGWAIAGAPRDRVQGVVRAGSVRAFNVPAVPFSYCTGKPNSQGCVPFVTSIGVASLSSPAPFVIAANNVLPNKAGVLVYGSRKVDFAFHGGRSCVRSPLVRCLPVRAQPSGSEPCAAVLTHDFRTRLQSGADPALSVGRIVFAQWIQSDPADPAGFGDSLSDALRFVVCP